MVPQMLLLLQREVADYTDSSDAIYGYPNTQLSKHTQSDLLTIR